MGNFASYEHFGGSRDSPDIQKEPVISEVSNHEGIVMASQEPEITKKLTMEVIQERRIVSADRELEPSFADCVTFSHPEDNQVRAILVTKMGLFLQINLDNDFEIENRFRLNQFVSHSIASNCLCVHKISERPSDLEYQILVSGHNGHITFWSIYNPCCNLRVSKSMITTKSSRVLAMKNVSQDSKEIVLVVLSTFENSAFTRIALVEIIRVKIERNQKKNSMVLESKSKPTNLYEKSGVRGMNLLRLVSRRNIFVGSFLNRDQTDIHILILAFMDIQSGRTIRVIRDNFRQFCALQSFVLGSKNKEFVFVSSSKEIRIYDPFGDSESAIRSIVVKETGFLTHAFPFFTKSGSCLKLNNNFFFLGAINREMGEKEEGSDTNYFPIFIQTLEIIEDEESKDGFVAFLRRKKISNARRRRIWTENERKESKLMLCDVLCWRDEWSNRFLIAANNHWVFEVSFEGGIGCQRETKKWVRDQTLVRNDERERIEFFGRENSDVLRIVEIKLSFGGKTIRIPSTILFLL